ncbi:MAG: VOC family protein [Actinophytocola sp.]|uniref:VOC family protein n=1 Tax=Actinophytocola sp. TaxID=1872138 RepID=UPI003D6BD931
MSPAGLWLPYPVADLDEATAFYTDRVGLSIADRWSTPGERGVVLAAGAAFVELVEPGDPRPTPLAFQLADTADVDAAAVRLAGRPVRYPRGLYGFTTDGPAGARVMIWSERE